MKLVEIYQAPNFRDDARMREHLLAYRQACPSDTRAYTMAAPTGDTEFLKETAAALRPVLEKRTDADALAAYPTLWNMEFKLVPLSRQDEVRDRVRTDVARLRTMDQSAKLAPTLLQGYKMLGDNEGIQWAEKNLPPVPGRSPAIEAIDKWQRANQPKFGGDYEKYHAKLLVQAEEWIRRWPDDPYPRYQKFFALYRQRDAPLEKATEAAEEWLRVYEAHPGSNFTPYDMVAAFYARHNMRYDELPVLLEKYLKSVGEPPPSSLSDRYPPNTEASMMANFSRWSTWNGAAGIYLKIKQYDQTRDLLAKLETWLRENRPAPDASYSQISGYRSQEVQFWTNKAGLAEAEDHKLDALMFRRNAHLLNPFPVAPGGHDFTVDPVKDLWRELDGGTDEGFEAFLHRPVTPATRRAFCAPWPPPLGNGPRWTSR